MRLVVNDYAGHPFLVLLSRQLAKRGHDVLYVYSASNNTPQGELAKTVDDPAGYLPKPIVLAEQIQKRNFLKRRKLEIEYGVKAGAEIKSFKPECVVCANTPLDSMKEIWDAADAVHSRKVFSFQDVIGEAAKRLLSQKLPIVGGFIGDFYLRLEASLLKRSDAVVPISDAFLPHLPPGCKNVSVIQNWAPIDDLPLKAKVNPWSIANQLDETFNFIYSGTIGLKHNPMLLVDLARSFSKEPTVRVVVITSESSVAVIHSLIKGEELSNLILLPFQPFNVVPEVMGAADVLTAILEPDAGVFSVPSKVLSYLCAGRPLLVSMPLENLSSKIVSGSGAGFVASPEKVDDYIQLAHQLFHDKSAREKMGAKAREYAEGNFNIDEIARKFEAIARLK